MLQYLLFPIWENIEKEVKPLKDRFALILCFVVVPLIILAVVLFDWFAPAPVIRVLLLFGFGEIIGGIMFLLISLVRYYHGKVPEK